MIFIVLLGKKIFQNKFNIFKFNFEILKKYKTINKRLHNVL